jgi:hypothetical protein
LLNKKDYIKFKELLTNYLIEQKEQNSNAWVNRWSVRTKK